MCMHLETGDGRGLYKPASAFSQSCVHIFSTWKLLTKLKLYNEMNNLLLASINAPLLIAACDVARVPGG